MAHRKARTVMQTDFRRTAREAGNVTFWLMIILLGAWLLFTLFSFARVHQRVSEARQRARQEIIKIDFSRFNRAVSKYRIDHQKYPSRLEDLTEAGVRGPYLHASPIDPYTELPYHWEVVDGKPSLVSFGADGVPGGTGPNADLRSNEFDR